MAGEPVFIDTNALIYANQATATLHAKSLERLDRWMRDGTPLWISRQVLREYLAVMSRPGLFSQILPAEVLMQRVFDFSRIFHVADEGHADEGDIPVAHGQSQRLSSLFRPDSTRTVDRKIAQGR